MGHHLKQKNNVVLVKMTNISEYLDNKYNFKKSGFVTFLYI